VRAAATVPGPVVERAALEKKIRTAREKMRKN
jgi:hypothetical protein